MLDFNKSFDFDNIGFNEKPKLEAGWQELRLVNIGQERDEKSGKGKGLFCTFAGESGGTFDEYFCTAVSSSFDSWRVERTEAFFSYIAKISGLEIMGLEELLNVPFYALLEEKTIPARASIDPMTLEKIELPARLTVGFSKGALSKILKGKGLKQTAASNRQSVQQEERVFNPKRQAARPKPHQAQEIVFEENDVPF